MRFPSVSEGKNFRKEKPQAADTSEPLTSISLQHQSSKNQVNPSEMGILILPGKPQTSSDLQATPFLPRTGLRSTQPRDEERQEDPRRAGIPPAPRRPSSSTGCQGGRDSRLQTPEVPLVEERSRHRSTQAKRLTACGEETRRGQLLEVCSGCVTIGAACSPTSSPTIPWSRRPRSVNAGLLSNRQRLS